MGKHRKKVETKVKASTVAAFIGFSALLYVLQAVQGEPLLLNPLPDVLEPLALAVLPALVTLAAGWKAKHTFVHGELKPVDEKTDTDAY